MLLRWRRGRPRARVAALVVVTGVVAGGAYYWFGVRDGESASAAEATSTTTSVAASLTTMEKTVTGTGTLTPTVQESVAFEVSGTVTSVAVTAGQVVTAGQTLATVDTLTLDAELLAAKATLASAEAKLSDAQDEDDGTDAAQAQVASLEAQVALAQADVDDATEAMAGATLVSPVAGLVTAVDLLVGDVVTGSSGSSGTSGSSGSGASAGAAGSGSSGTSTSTTSTTTGAFTIVGTDGWEVTTTVDDGDVALVAAGDQVELTSDDLDDTVYGTVREVGLVSTSTSGVAAYPVVVDVTGSPQGLHDGVEVDVEIIYERRTDVLTVPTGAVTTTDGESVVTQTGADGAQVTTVVTLGETSGSVVEVLTGLAEGDEVLVTTFTPAATQGDEGSGTTEQRFPTDGQMPDFSNMPEGGPQMGGRADG